MKNTSSRRQADLREFSRDRSLARAVQDRLYRMKLMHDRMNTVILEQALAIRRTLMEDARSSSKP